MEIPFKKQLTMGLLTIGVIAISYNVGVYRGSTKMPNGTSKTTNISSTYNSDKQSVATSNKTNHRVTTITENKDGSKSTQVVEDIAQNTNKTSNEKIASTQTVTQTITISPSKYRVGGTVGTKISEYSLDYSVSAGMRAFGNLWVDSSYFVKQKSLNIGISLEF